MGSADIFESWNSGRPHQHHPVPQRPQFSIKCWPATRSPPLWTIKPHDFTVVPPHCLHNCSPNFLCGWCNTTFSQPHPPHAFIALASSPGPLRAWGRGYQSLSSCCTHLWLPPEAPARGQRSYMTVSRPPLYLQHPHQHIPCNLHQHTE